MTETGLVEGRGTMDPVAVGPGGAVDDVVEVDATDGDGERRRGQPPCRHPRSPRPTRRCSRWSTG